MTGFANLPNELILALWRQVLDPNAVESFALTSKRTYALGSNFIREHNELRARFSFIHHRQDRVCSGLVEILKTMLQNPRATLLIRNFDTDGWRSKWDVSNNSETPGHRPYPEDTVELFRQSIKNSPFNLEDEISCWLNALKTGNEGPIFSLILTMLPNLQSLRSSAITHLTFIKCSIETRRLASFLEGMRALESFEYLSTDSISEPEDIVDALLAHAKRTLRKLCLRSDGQKMNHGITLAKFEVMNELDIAYGLLLNPLARILLPSIEKVRLSRIDINWAYTLDNDVLEITAGKAERLPNLKELTVELLRNDEDCELLSNDEDCEDCELLLDGDALNAATITTMKQQCEGVGVRFSATFEPPVPREWMDWYSEEAISE